MWKCHVCQVCTPQKVNVHNMCGDGFMYSCTPYGIRGSTRIFNLNVYDMRGDGFMYTMWVLLGWGWRHLLWALCPHHCLPSNFGGWGEDAFKQKMLNGFFWPSHFYTFNQCCHPSKWCKNEMFWKFECRALSQLLSVFDFIIAILIDCRLHDSHWCPAMWCLSGNNKVALTGNIWVV